MCLNVVWSVDVRADIKFVKLGVFWSGIRSSPTFGKGLNGRRTTFCIRWVKGELTLCVIAHSLLYRFVIFIFNLCGTV